MSEKNEENDPSKRGRVECDNIKSPLSECAPPVKNITHPLRYYEFTRDEIKALEECDKESFYRRCLPYSTLLATATYAAVKYGFLKKNRHFGAFPKVLLAFLFGHFYGRYAFIPLCEEKLRHLPGNSYLGNLMRKNYCERLCKSKAAK